MGLGLDRRINQHLFLLKVKLPYHESDHVLTHVYNLYAGGHGIEDIAHLQHSEAIQSLLGACRIPDPTTAGDFLRRFQALDLMHLQEQIDAAREAVWHQLPPKRRRRATVDLDSTIKEVYGECKAGADFSYNKKWSYHPLVATLAETYEPLRTIIRSGNAASADGAGVVLEEVLPMVQRHFREVFVRGDSKFYRRDVIEACEAHGTRFALVMDHYDLLLDMAGGLRESEWKPLGDKPSARPGKKSKRSSRRKRERARDQIVRRRGYKALQTTEQSVAEFYYPGPARKDRQERTYRVIAKRQRVETHKGQALLFTEHRYRFVFTNIPCSSMSAAEVLHLAHGRGDQENAIEQLKNGIAALRMPTGELLANGAFLMMGQLAWCLRTWLSLLALPAETVRWEWKWFRQAFVHVAAKITHGARRAVVYLAGSHRFVQHLLIAAERLRSFVFR
jgi:hypothetical protein